MNLAVARRAKAGNSPSVRANIRTTFLIITTVLLTGCNFQFSTEDALDSAKKTTEDLLRTAQEVESGAQKKLDDAYDATRIDPNKWERITP